MDNGWEVFDERHFREYQYWIKNIKLGITKRQKGEWNVAQYHEHMIKIAKEVRIPSEHIQELEKELIKLKEEKENE